MEMSFPFSEESNLDGVHFSITQKNVHRQGRTKRIQTAIWWALLLPIVIAFGTWILGRWDVIDPTLSPAVQVLSLQVATIPDLLMTLPCPLAAAVMSAGLLIERFFPEHQRHFVVLSVGERGITIDEKLWSWDAYRFVLKRGYYESNLMCDAPDLEQPAHLARLRLTEEQHERITAVMDAARQQHQQKQTSKGAKGEVPAALQQLLNN